MAPEATARRSAASLNYDNHRSGGASADSRSRRGLTREAQRATAGPAAIAWYAKQNPAINVEKTHLNIDRVNDGAGGFRRTRSIDEVVTYGDERAARVKGLQDGHRFAVTSVGHLPWAYVEEDGTEYQVVGKDGRPKFLPGGEPQMQPRYRIRPDRYDEAMAYFDDWLDFAASRLPDGKRGIHGYSINVDESRPHIQVLSDPFEPAPSKKSPDALKNGYSRAFGAHPKDGMVPQLDGAGNPVLGDDGEPRLVREGPSRKMERYQAELRAYMVERGYEVDPERDEERHNRHLSLPDYKELEQQKTVVQMQQADLGAALADVEDAHIAFAAELSAVEAETVAEHGIARAEGYTAGLRSGMTDGRAQVQADLDEAEAARTTAEADRGTAATDRSAAEQARQVAEAHAEALAEERQRAQADLDAAAEAKAAAAEAAAEARRRLDAIPVYDPRSAEEHAPAELIRNLKPLKTDTGEPVLAVAHKRGIENHKRIQANQGVDAKTYLTETIGQRRKREDAFSQGVTDGHRQAAKQKQDGTGMKGPKA